MNIKSFALLLPVYLLLSLGPALAVYPPPQQGNLLFGQKHNYTVVFRNDGAATVLGRIVLKNTEKDPVKELSLTIPEAQVSDAVFYQVSIAPQCVEYSPEPVMDSQPRCLRQSFDQLYLHPQYWGVEEYKKLSPGRINGTLTIPLSFEIKEDEAGGIIFAYRTRNYSKLTWAGAYRFVFSTPQVSSPVESVIVAVGVDSDLYLKGSKSKVAYKEESALAPTDLAAPSIGRAIDLYQQQGFTKEGRNLGRGESLVVKGWYADAWWKLYPWEIIGSFLGLVIFFFLWYLWRRHYHPTKQTAGPYTGIFTPANVGVAFASALSTVGLTYLVRNLPQYYPWFYDQVSTTLFALVTIGFYAAILFGPALVVGFSRAGVNKVLAWQHFLFILFAELLLLAVMLVIYINIVPSRPSPIRPLSSPASEVGPEFVE